MTTIRVAALTTIALTIGATATIYGLWLWVGVDDTNDEYNVVWQDDTMRRGTPTGRVTP